MALSLNCKIWIESDGKKVFGDGPCEILQRVKQTGSLRMAAAEMNMSYSQAWKLIDDLESKLGFSLLHKRAGGHAGGGSVLTEEGEEFAGKYAQFRREALEKLEILFKKHFNR
ncbi:MAG TPA: LysR family transcriptional regulator [Firmicutes bacterium]|jgi:molybdate transport system regulatory protein|nr:LysR family transcriptional regulator [Bacillota bacterium]